ncbi:MAG: hypothetical protein U0835_01265 [Isosphaeraceae bacterium]
MTGLGVVRDERTVLVEDRGCRLGFNFVLYALLFDVMYRSLARNEGAWDLLAIVVLGGVVSTLYQWRNRVLTASAIRPLALTMIIAAVVSFAVGLLIPLLAR